jgi:phage terminase Nu1 subunit (DNA packaging protein)
MKFTSYKALAAACKVSTDTARKWRVQGCPESLELADIEPWLRLHRIRAYHALRAYVAAQATPTDAVGPEVVQAEAPEGSEDLDWSKRAARAKALKAELELAQAQRVVVPVEEARRWLGQVMAEIKEHLGRGIYQDLAPALDAAPDHVRRYVRNEHEKAMAKLQQRIWFAVRSRMSLLRAGGEA